MMTRLLRTCAPSPPLARDGGSAPGDVCCLYLGTAAASSWSKNDRPSVPTSGCAVALDRSRCRRRNRTREALLFPLRRQLRPPYRPRSARQFRRLFGLCTSRVAGSDPAVPILRHRGRRHNTRRVCLRGLEIAFNDYLLRPVDKERIGCRGRAPQIRKAPLHPTNLRDNVHNIDRYGITDALTGLHNRRYMDKPSRHPSPNSAASRGKPLGSDDARPSILQGDQRHYGHDAGDDRSARIRGPGSEIGSGGIEPFASAIGGEDSSS